MTRRQDVTIGVDVGTSGCKAIVLGSSGRLLHTAQASYATRRTVAGEVTQDPRAWLKAVRQTLNECAQAADGRHVAGLGITAPAHAAVICDADGEPLAPSLLAFDARPAATARKLKARYGDDLFKVTYVDLSAGWTLAQLTWLREQAPQLWPRIRWMLTQKDWIRYRLTGTALIDTSDAAGTAMIDQASASWLEPVCTDLGLSSEQLPPIVSSTAPGGRLTAFWARATGIAQGTPVVVGATDTAAELLSVGAVSAGDSLVKIASTGTVVGVSAEPVVDRRLLTYPHPVPGQWYTLAATNTATVAYQWLRETVFAAPAAAPAVTYEDINRRASRVSAGSEGVLFLPFLEGERTPYWDAHLRGAFLGLSSAHRREHLARAVLEGVAMALRDCRDVMERAGLPVQAPYLAGGGTSSRLWRTILVSALGQPGVVAEPQGPAVGAAIMAFASDATTATQILQRAPAPRTRRVEPVQEWVITYDALHHTYRLAAEAVTGVSHRLSGATDEHPDPG
jgi:xylulokinase